MSMAVFGVWCLSLGPLCYKLELQGNLTHPVKRRRVVDPFGQGDQLSDTDVSPNVMYLDISINYDKCISIIYLSVCPFVLPSVRLSNYLSVYLSIYLSIQLSIDLSL